MSLFVVDYHLPHVYVLCFEQLLLLHSNHCHMDVSTQCTKKSLSTCKCYIFSSFCTKREIKNIVMKSTYLISKLCVTNSPQ